MLSRLVLSILFLTAANTAMATEEPDYDVLLQAENYEVRRYAPYIVAEVDVDGDLKASGNEAFRILAGYIFGENEPAEKMRMTAPVETSRRNGIKMRMTAPVVSDPPADGRQTWTYAFVMEQRYTLATLPRPQDRRIRLRPVPARVVAARRYSGTWSEARYVEEESALFEALATDRIDTVGAPIFARYNGPFAPWFLRRNEVIVEVRWPRTGGSKQ